jgi:hypothetical protein
MNIELNKNEVETLSLALDAWEKEESCRAFTTELLTTMLSAKEDRDTNASMRRLKEVEEGGKDRKIKSCLLKAKLYQAIAKDSEHTLV